MLLIGFHSVYRGCHFLCSAGHHLGLQVEGNVAVICRKNWKPEVPVGTTEVWAEMCREACMVFKGSLQSLTSRPFRHPEKGFIPSALLLHLGESVCPGGTGPSTPQATCSGVPQMQTVSHTLRKDMTAAAPLFCRLWLRKPNSEKCSHVILGFHSLVVTGFLPRPEGGEVLRVGSVGDANLPCLWMCWAEPTLTAACEETTVVPS